MGALEFETGNTVRLRSLAEIVEMPMTVRFCHPKGVGEKAATLKRRTTFMTQPNNQLQKFAPQTATALQRVGGIEKSELDFLGQIFYKSGFFSDAKSEAQAIVKILAGKEFGLTAIQAMTNVHIISGKPTLSSTAQAAVIKASGKYNYRILEQEMDRCEIEFYEKFNGEWLSIGKSKFTIEEAKKADLLKNPNWSRYPADMLFARTITRGLKRFCPDLIRGDVGESDFIPEPVVDAPEVTTPEVFEQNVQSVEQDFIEAEVETEPSSLDIIETLLANLAGDDQIKREAYLKGRVPGLMTEPALEKLIDELQSQIDDKPF